MKLFARALLPIAAVAAILATLAAIVPLRHGLLQFAVLLWFAVPGFLLALGLYRGQPGRSIASLLVGPAWGYALSIVALLALWASGVRAFGWLMLAPLAASLAAWPLGRIVTPLMPPAFTRRDLAPWALVVLAVPAIVGLPYAHVGIDLPEGRAYRAYFTADFVWQMAVVSEVSKGDVPPRNPYLVNDDMHYYWATHLLAAVEHRAAGRTVRIEELLLVDALWSALAFVGFFYFFVRHFVDRPWFAASACVGVLFCSSFEGIHQIWSLWDRGRPLDALRTLNIDAMTRWMFQGMPIDGLHRLLLYQPQHQLAYLLSLSALLLVRQAADVARPSILFVVGVFFSLAMFMSPFAAGVLAVAVAVYSTWRLLEARQWRGFVMGLLVAAPPMVAALAVSRQLGYVDPEATFLRLGLNPIASRQWAWAIFLSFGPVLIIAAAGLVFAVVRRSLSRFVPVLIVLAVCTVFYFLVDVPDVQGVYVGWHVGKMAYVAFAALCGFALQEAWQRPLTRAGFGITAVLVALAGLPTVVIDLYNTQDVWNRGEGPGFRWTVLLSPEEIQAIDWIRQWAPPAARVQVEPYVRGRDTWAWVPAFAERRMAAGLPISMVPLKKYETASERIRAVYRANSAKDAYGLAADACIDYLVVGPPERAAYPQLQGLADAAPYLFNPVFRNGSFAIYAISTGTKCPHE